MRTKKLAQTSPTTPSLPPSLAQHTEARLIGLREGQEGFVDIISTGGGWETTDNTGSVSQSDGPFDSYEIGRRCGGMMGFDLDRLSWEDDGKERESYLVGWCKRSLGEYLMSGDDQVYAEVKACARDMRKRDCECFARFLAWLEEEEMARVHFSDGQLAVIRETERYFMGFVIQNLVCILRQLMRIVYRLNYQMCRIDF